MKYVALLRGINVGGNNIIKMIDLKKSIEECGFTNVMTYIQSGNIIFESDEINLDSILTKLENSLRENFHVSSGIVIKTLEQLKNIISEVPADWKNRNDLRCYIAFIRGPVSAKDAVRDIELKEDIDFIKAGNGVLYMSTLLSGLTRSRFTRLITKTIYKDITIRNYNTVQKLLSLMQEG
jgi:uncharacterized protein (DUF1697 family)